MVKSLKDVTDLEVLNKLKFVDDVLDELPAASSLQLQLFEWIAYYYHCTEGEVLKAALPAGLKPESILKIESVEGVTPERLNLDEKEYDLLDLLRVRASCTLSEVSELWNVQNPMTRLRQLNGRGLVRLTQELAEIYKPKYETYVELAETFKDEDLLEEAFESLSRAPKQEEVLMLVVTEHFQAKSLSRSVLGKRIKGAAGAIRALVDKGILDEKKVRVDRMEGLTHQQVDKDLTFTPLQEEALTSIRTHFIETPQKPVLLHGVTGSGKTFLYIELIREMLDQGKEVLYLLPEIGLTKQIIDRVRSEFGDLVGVYHSRFNDQERVEIWEKVIKREYKVIIGVRSAIFLPFHDPGLIIVDEEHDHSFKQAEPNPRYQARDVAVYAGFLWNCRVLLGSATPSFETYFNAINRKYSLVELPERATVSKLPDIRLVNMGEQRRKKLSTGSFSDVLIAAIRERLERKEQVILFQNRRGYAPYLICNTCGHVPKCINCDISLTYHKYNDHLRCHYCGYTDYLTDKCSECGNYELRLEGLGTERIEEEAKEIFPEARIARMDWDTTRTKLGFQKLIQQFEQHDLDLLVGTQMVAKGLDFENVTLVGVMDADQMLNYPNFRAYENAYQLLTQVSGRAGRAVKPGEVLIQTAQPENPVLKMVQKDFRIFYEFELPTRKELNYPPYTRMIRIALMHRDRDYILREAMAFKQLLQPAFINYMLGPEFPPVARIRNVYRLHFMLKLPKHIQVAKVREVLSEKIDQYYREAEKKTLRIVVDIDPL